MSVESHKAAAPARVACAVLIVSDTRTLETDTSGRAITDLLADAGHPVVTRQLVRDDAIYIGRVMDRLTSRDDVQAVIVTGGTGLSTRDSTVDAVAPLIERWIEGFGELFRMLSYQDIGSAALLSRATAGVVGTTVVFLLPGAEKAVRLAMEKLILPELGHIVRELNRA